MLDQTHPQPSRTIDLKDICPSEWGFAEGGCSIHISCYRIFLSPSDELNAVNLKVSDVLGWRVFVLLGSIPYSYAGDFVIHPWNGRDPLQVSIGGNEDRTTPEGAYMVLLTKYLANDAETLTAAPEDSIVGLIRLRLGRNAAFDKVFSNAIAPNGQRSAFTDRLENPGWIGPPALSENALATLAGRISSLPDLVKNRLLLALRWVTRSDEVRGTDAFISLWVALETLAMPNTTNCAELRNELSRIYKLPKQIVGGRFLIGRLYEIRVDIVHHGRLHGIDANILAYMRAILADVVDDMLNVPLRSRALGMLDGAPGEAILRLALK